jgi:hypothetical protein
MVRKELIDERKHSYATLPHPYVAQNSRHKDTTKSDIKTDKINTKQKTISYLIIWKKYLKKV